MQIKRDDLPFLDGVRGCAALIVVASHFGRQNWTGNGITLTGAGKAGVYLFFVLSAFLLTRILVQRPFWRPYEVYSFFFRRTVRIFPLFCVVLILCLLTGIPYAMTPEGALSHLVLAEGRGVLWSIPVEFKFYFVLPFLALALLWLVQRSPWLVVAFAIVGCMAVEIWLLGKESRQAGTFMPAYAQIFLLGAALGSLDGRSQIAPNRWFSLLFWIGLGIEILLVPDIFERLTGLEGWRKTLSELYLVHGFAWFCVLAGLRYGSAMLHAPFEHRIMRRLGVISFSIYLWHEAVIAVLVRTDYAAPASVAWILPLAVTLLISEVSFRCIEKPFLKIDPRSLLNRLNLRTS